MLMQTSNHDYAPWWSSLKNRSLLMSWLAWLFLASPSALAAARSTHVVIGNNSERTMTFISGSTQHRVVTMNSPRTILPSAIGELFAESKGVATGTEGSVQWEWTKRYRIWEANRKIFLYPENWLEPEFRNDKTHLLPELECALLRADVSSDLIEEVLPQPCWRY